MKHQTLLRVISLCLYTSTIFAQSTQPDAWHPLLTAGITGASYKVLPVTNRSKTMLGLSGRITTPQNPDRRLFTPENMARTEQSLYQQPALREQLFERLGGEFWFGTPSQPGAFTDTHTTMHRSMGLQLTLPLGRRWAIQAGVSKGHHTATAIFPVTVFGHQNGQTKQEQGNLRTEMTGIHINSGGRFYLSGSGMLRPFAGAGLEYSRYKSSDFEAGLAGVSWAFGAPVTETYWAVSLPLGLSVQPHAWPVFAEIGGGALCSLQGKMEWSAQVTVGGRF